MAEVERDLRRPHSLTPVQAGPSRARCTGPCPEGFWRSQTRRPHNLWAATQHRSSAWCSEWTVCQFFANCLLSWHWSPLNRAWLRSLFTLPSHIYSNEIPFEPPVFWARCSLPHLSAFLHTNGASVSSSYSWPFAGLSSVFQGVSCSREPRTRHNTPGVASPMLSREEGATPSAHWLY